MAWYWYVLIVIAGGAAAIYLTGAALPRNHSAARSAEIAAPPEAVFAKIADFEKRPSWRKDVKTVKVEPGGRFVIEETSMGAIRYEVVELAAPRRLVTRIADDALEFGGTWTIEVQAAPEGSLVTVREDGFVKSPVFRFLSRFVFGHTRTMDDFLRDLRA
jgi:hypothetical protein